MKEIRNLAKTDDDIRDAVVESVRPIKQLLGEVFERLSLKGKQFKTVDAAADLDLDKLWEELTRVDASVERGDTTKAKIKPESELLKFFETHCVQRHYMFSVKKYGEGSCNVCKEPRLPADVFSTLSHLPDPIPNGEHYKDFDSVYGTTTTEENLPSLSEKSKKGHGMTYSPAAQTAKNANLVIQCDSCGKWRVLYAERKLQNAVRERVTSELEQLSYSCGSLIRDVNIDETNDFLSFVNVRANITCKSTIEVPYYGAGHEPICYHCGTTEGLESKEKHSPLCTECNGKKLKWMPRRTHNFKPK